ncbi:rhodanese-like domain-containing protein [Bacillus timonensis]|uniref:Rhodanese-like domain-containing protein n=1 Tax=Bacillus timonensis TaxID=1033734 RepID=A0A4S3PTU6_9BACI|nr:rhodanese-like domain-containing protein [Bacillus timonensis]THE13048.1 rhodanese-like domain-containing protein [Bacillus timonensis]
MPLKKITPEELYQKMNEQEKVVLLDVRAEDKYNDFHIEGPTIESQNLYKAEILNNGKAIDSLPKNKEIIVTCTTGNSATKCANILSEHEYNVAVLEGGITAWKEYLKTK